jgi:cytochrome c
MRSILTLGAVFISAHCMAQTGPANNLAAAAELAKANGCYSCHAAAEKIVGPAFKDIAAKYKDDKDAVASLAQSIQYGSKGKWGRIPMPAHAALSGGDLKALAGWVMTTQP